MKEQEKTLEKADNETVYTLQFTYISHEKYWAGVDE